MSAGVFERLKVRNTDILGHVIRCNTCGFRKDSRKCWFNFHSGELHEVRCDKCMLMAQMLVASEGEEWEREIFQRSEIVEPSRSTIS